MIRSQILFPCIASALLCACKSTHQAPAQARQEELPLSTEVFEISDDGHPRTDLLTAIATAKASAPGARFLGATLESEESPAIYRIVLVGEGNLHVIDVDAVDGRIAGAQEGKFDEESEESPDAMFGGPSAVAVEQLVGAALAAVPGSWAQSAWPMQLEEQAAYCVLVTASGADKYVYVSASDGKVLQVCDTPPEGEDEGEEGMEMQETEAQPVTPAVPPK